MFNSCNDELGIIWSQEEEQTTRTLTLTLTHAHNTRHTHTRTHTYTHACTHARAHTQHTHTHSLTYKHNYVLQANRRWVSFILRKMHTGFTRVLLYLSRCELSTSAHLLKRVEIFGTPLRRFSLKPHYNCKGPSCNYRMPCSNWQLPHQLLLVEMHSSHGGKSSSFIMFGLCNLRFR